MEEELQKAIKNVAERAAKSQSADESLKYTQAALNAAHALATVRNIGLPPKD